MKLKESDKIILAQIDPIIKERPTYGYKRVTAILNNFRETILLPNINKKKIYRIMKTAGLLLPKSQITRTHTGTGKVMTLHSNTRWCTDCFEIKCYNGEKVYVIFALDTCDREVISFIAKKTPILASDVQDLMINAVEKRFLEIKTPREIEWLSDRGAIYRALSVQNLARELGLKCCYTAAYSPESNGMAEALVKTIKRDYVYVNDCVSADTVLEMIPNWFADYNEKAPHSALGMKSPLEYKRQVANY